MNFDGDLHSTNARNVDNPEWLQAKTRGRWAPYWNPATRTYAPPSSPRRTEARKKKYAWSALTMRGGPEFVPLELCMTGDELLAERAHVRGDGSSFECVRTDEARELVALLPHGRLRRVECMLLVALSYAMCVRRRHGLVATVDELAAFVGLRSTATSEGMARLIALGLVRADATFTRYGACWSQRGNLWRLTAQAVAAFALYDVPAGVTLPAGVVDRDRLGRRRRTPVRSTDTVGSHAHTTPRNPDPIPDVRTNTDENSGSFRNGPRPSSEIDGPTTATAAVGPARRQAESCHAPRRAPEGQGFTPDALAELVRDPRLREAILAAKKGRPS